MSLLAKKQSFSKKQTTYQVIFSGRSFDIRIKIYYHPLYLVAYQFWQKKLGLARNKKVNHAMI